MTQGLNILGKRYIELDVTNQISDNTVISVYRDGQPENEQISFLNFLKNIDLRHLKDFDGQTLVNNNILKYNAAQQKFIAGNLVSADIPTLQISKVQGLQNALDGKASTFNLGNITSSTIIVTNGNNRVVGGNVELEVDISGIQGNFVPSNRQLTFSSSNNSILFEGVTNYSINLSQNREINFTVGETVLRRNSGNVITALHETRRAGANDGNSNAIVKRWSIGTDELYKLDLMNAQNRKSPSAEVEFWFRYTSNAGAGIAKERPMIAFTRPAINVFGGSQLPTDIYNNTVSNEISNSGNPNWRNKLINFSYGYSQFEEKVIIGDSYLEDESEDYALYAVGKGKFTDNLKARSFYSETLEVEMLNGTQYNIISFQASDIAICLVNVVCTTGQDVYFSGRVIKRPNFLSRDSISSSNVESGTSTNQIFRLVQNSGGTVTVKINVIYLNKL